MLNSLGNLIEVIKFEIINGYELNSKLFKQRDDLKNILKDFLKRTAEEISLLNKKYFIISTHKH